MNLRTRLKSVAFHLGATLLFPALLFRGRDTQTDLYREYSRALAVSLIGSAAVLAGVLIWVFGFYAVALWSPGSLESLRFKGLFILAYPILLLLFGAATLWLLSFIGAVLGKKPALPWVGKIVKKRGLLTASYCINGLFVLFLCWMVWCGWHASRMAARPIRPAKVYMLYDDMGFVPRWVFPLGFYRIQRASAERWGANHVSIDPVTRESLDEALQNAELIFLSVHGDYSWADNAGCFHFFNAARDQIYIVGPDEIEKTGTGTKLKYIYLAHCNSGARHDDWARAFDPAGIKSFDRFSLYPEHIFWLWIKLPRLIRRGID